MNVYPRSSLTASSARPNDTGPEPDAWDDGMSLPPDWDADDPGPSDDGRGSYDVAPHPSPTGPVRRSMVGRPPKEILSEVFGYDGFRGEQAEIVDHVVAGKNALVLMPTGGGKSVCFQIPALARKGVTIVISPLLALMYDQVQHLNQLGIPAAEISSARESSENSRTMAAMRRGDIELVYVSPERFVMQEFQRALNSVDIALFAIDEAHCVSSWGHDFRKEYLQVGDLCAERDGVPRIALTATADRATRKDMIERLHLKDARTFLSSFDRPNINIDIVEKADVRRQLLDFMAPHKGESGIVYCLSRKKVEETANFLRTEGYDALPYHGQISPDVKKANLDRFLNDEAVVVVATVAFGMGIDKPDVRFVAHIDLPTSMEGYYQEIGRAGRDGLRSDVWMAYGAGDIIQRRRFIDDGEGDEAHKRSSHQKLRSLVGFAESPRCRRATMLNYFEETYAGSDNCGMCDRCLRPVETFDGTIEAQKALSAAHRTGQRFGGGHLIDIVVGDATRKVTEKGHDRLPTFGVGKGRSKEWWGHILRQMVAEDLFSSPPEAHGAYVVTPRGREVLRNELAVQFVAPSVRSVSKGGGRSAKGAGASTGAVARSLVADLPQNRRDLHDALRKMRTEQSRAQGVPPYVVFSDVTLISIVAAMPATRDALSRVNGIGASKLSRYGDQLLELVAQHRIESQTQESVQVPSFGRGR